MKCDKCGFNFYSKNGAENLNLHKKYSCDSFIKRLKTTKSALVNVYGDNWKRYWLGKIPTYLKED